MNAARLIDRANRLLTRRTAALAAIVPLSAAALPSHAATLGVPYFAVVFYSGLWNPPGTATATTTPDGGQVTMAGQVATEDGATWDAEDINDNFLGLFSRGAGIGTLNRGDSLAINYDVDVQLTGGTATLAIFADFFGLTPSQVPFQTFTISSDQHLQGTISGQVFTQDFPVNTDDWLFFVEFQNWTGYAQSDQISLTTSGTTFSIASVPEPLSVSFLMLGSTLLLIRRGKPNRRRFA